jgi:hypothetical protein
VRLRPARSQPISEEQAVAVTTWVMITDVLPSKPVEPLKVATMLCPPVVLGATEQVAGADRSHTVTHTLAAEAVDWN